MKSLLAYGRLAEAALDAITTEIISGFVSARQQRGLEVSSVNRELQVLRRMFNLAQEWEKMDKALPRVKMLPGERHKERVLRADEEGLYFGATRSNAMQRHQDPDLLHDVAGILIDCGLRPEECFRLRSENVRDVVLEIPHGKSENER